MMAHRPLLDVRDLVVAFEGHGGLHQAVDGLSFSIGQGASVALVGESGSGKSVTAQAILGILPRNARLMRGEIRFAPPGLGGESFDLAKLDPDGPQFLSLRGGEISMIFQEPMTALSPLHTIGNQVSEALALHVDIAPRERRARTEGMLRLVGFDDPRRAYNSYPFELSGGLRQRALIAMALICRPSLLIADEPSTALDVTIQAQILKVIQDLRRELKMALLLITHDLGVVANMAEQVVVMYRGRVMESGDAVDLYGDPQHPYLRGLLDAIPHFNMREGERLRPLRSIPPTQGHLLRPRATHDALVPEVGPPPPLLEVRGISKRYAARRAGLFSGERTHHKMVVDNMSLRLPRGGCVGLVGESGCGKTTVSKIIMRAIRADAGQVLFDEGDGAVDLLALDRGAMFPYRSKIQYVFQDPHSSLNPRMTIYDILSEPLIIHGVGDRSYRRDLVEELMRRVGLDPLLMGRHPHSFSGGQRQRIGIARALALRPLLVICDEPVSALDVSVQAQILNLLKDLQSELRLSYLFISHNLAVVDYMADHILVMCAGRIVEEAPRETLFRAPVHPYTKALLAAIPYPSLTRKLDFAAIMDGRASDPARWPEPFTDHGGADAPKLIDLGGGRRVRSSAPVEALAQ